MRDSFDQTIIDERTAEIERLRKALEQIVAGYENPNIGHEEFRVKACQAARGALADVGRIRPVNAEQIYNRAVQRAWRDHEKMVDRFMSGKIEVASPCFDDREKAYVIMAFQKALDNRTPRD